MMSQHDIGTVYTLNHVFQLRMSNISTTPADSTLPDSLN